MRRLVLSSLLVMSFAMPARADFCMLTQNGLHLGQGAQDYLQAKRDGFRRIFKDYDVVVLQEVMQPDEPAQLAPDGFAATVSAPKGKSTYREHYAVLTRKAAVKVLDSADYPDPQASFARPPFGVAVEDKDGSRYWLVDIHAVFGEGGLAPRRLEVAAISKVMAHYAARPLPDGSTVDRVLVAGDWNLSATDKAFTDLGTAVPGAMAAPDIQSSLNAKGQYSSPYDHFVWNRRHLSVGLASDPRDTGGRATEDYRTTLSDHVGVAGYVMSAPDKARPDGVQCPPVRGPGM